MVYSCAAYNCKERRQKGGLYTFHSFPKDPQKRKAWVVALRRKDYNPSDHARVCSKHFTPDCFDTEKFGGICWLKADAVPTLFDFPRHLPKRPTIIKFLEKRQQRDSLQPTDATVNENQNSVLHSDSSPESSRCMSVVLSDSSRESASCTSIVLSDSSSENGSSPSTSIVLSNLSCENESGPCTSQEPISLLHYKPVKKKRRMFRYFGDCVEDFSDPVVAKKNWDIAVKQLLQYKQKAKSALQRCRRLEKRVANLTTMLSLLKD